jgi:hypothetical protein
MNLKKPIERVYPFKSKSNPSAPGYECRLYKDGTTSCNCPGWTRRNMNDVRECKHTMLVDQMREQETAIVTKHNLRPSGTRRLITT